MARRAVLSGTGEVLMSRVLLNRLRYSVARKPVFCVQSAWRATGLHADCDADPPIRVAICMRGMEPVRIATRTGRFASQLVWGRRNPYRLRRRPTYRSRNLYERDGTCTDYDANGSVCVATCMRGTEPVRITTQTGRFASQPVCGKRNPYGLRRKPGIMVQWRRRHATKHPRHAKEPQQCSTEDRTPYCEATASA